MQTQLRRGIAAIATSALSWGVLAVAAPAQAASDPQPARATAQWLVKNLNAQGLVESHTEWEGQVFSGPSYGTTVDLAEGLAKVGGQPAALKKAVDAIEANIDAYAGSGGETYSGSLAKAVSLLTSQGRDVTSLVTRLESTVTPTGNAVGRLADISPWGDYANSIGQSYAARALTAVGSPLADEVTDYLLAQQCSAGFFRLDFPRGEAEDEYGPRPADLTSDQSCDNAVPAEQAEQSADTTAIVIIQTSAMAKTDPEVAAARTRAATWLAEQQKSDGSFVDPNNGANANTTGLAGWALAEAGHGAAGAKAATWLRAKQVVAPCAPAAMRNEGGAVAYDQNAWNLDQQFGITELLDRSQWVIADVQALPALIAAPANPAKDAVVLPKFAKAGKNVTATVRGVAAGERACVTGSAGAKDLLGTGKDLTVTLATAKAGTRSIALKTATGTVSSSVKVLGKKRLTVKVAKTAKRGSKKVVTVKGLAAGEKITVRVKGKKVKVGTATKKGTFTLKVKVGKKRGTVKVSATGQYSTRTGTAKVKVR